MRTRRAIVTAAVILALVGAGIVALIVGPRSCDAQTEVPRVTGVGVSLATDRTVYGTGQPIAIELRAFNSTSEATLLQFRTAQRYDFVVQDSAGKTVWQWAAERMFAQVLGQESLGPSKPQIAYTDKYAGQLPPGTYKLTGTVTASNLPMSASVTFEVR